MKKLISLLLSVILCLSCFTVAAFAEDELTVAVANDLHYSLQYANKDYVSRNTPTKGYEHATPTGQLYTESEAIIDAFFKNIENNKSNYNCVLIPGDLVDKGTVEENTIFASKLKEYEKALGMPIYVVPGNHDLSRTTVEQFTSLYAEFGYNEAIERDELSASYVAELNSEYRLLAIDSNVAGKGMNAFTDEDRVEWIRTQAEQAQKEGKKVIAMMHHNLLTHFMLDNFFHEGATTDESTGLQEIFAQYGIKYTFSGHTHQHDIEAYTGSNGVTIYEAITSTINAYPCPYRTVSFTEENVDITTQYIDKIDPSALPVNLEDNVLALRNSDFAAYAENYAKAGLYTLVLSYLSADKLISLTGITKEVNEPAYNILVSVGNNLSKAVTMPLHIKDETDGNTSLERISVENGNDFMPDTDYNNFAEILVEFYQAHVSGDENFPIYSDEMCITSKALPAIMSYALSELSTEDCIAAVETLAATLGIELDESIVILLRTAITKYQGIEAFVATALFPMVTELTSDFGPADSNVTLPGYTELVEKQPELTFWQKILSFFQKIREFFHNLLTF